MQFLEDLPFDYDLTHIDPQLMSSSRFRKETLEELLFLDFMFDIRVNDERS